MQFRNAISKILAKGYGYFVDRSKMITVIGLVGKTTTVFACKDVLGQKFDSVEIIDGPRMKNLLKITPRTKKGIFEVNLEERQIENLQTLNPQTIIITRVDSQNLSEDTKKSISLLAQIITKLPKSGLAILNWDDPQIRKLAEETSAQILFYGMNADNCQIWAGNVRLENFRTVFELNYGVERVEINSNLLGLHQIYPLLAAGALGVSLDMPLLTIKKALEQVATIGSRMQILYGLNGSYVIDDTYEGSAVAVMEAIDCLSTITARRRILVLGKLEIADGFQDKVYRQVAQKIAREQIDLCFLGEGIDIVASELTNLGFLSERMQKNLTIPQMVGRLAKVLAKGDVVLIKGARNVRLDEVVKRITKQSLFNKKQKGFK